MNLTMPWKERVENIFGRRSVQGFDHAASRPTVLIATIDPEIRGALAELLQAFPLNAIWLKGVDAAKSVLAQERIAACFCGFWLQGGTYRELFRHIRRGSVEIPMIIVSAPACPNEYRDYLSAVKSGALEFLGHPYQKSELERILCLALGDRGQKGDRGLAIPRQGLHAGEAA